LDVLEEVFCDGLPLFVRISAGLDGGLPSVPASRPVMIEA
jgi:hypothetical protein